MEELPVEILEHIAYYCNDKSIMNLGFVNRDWYYVTKKKRGKIKGSVKEYSQDFMTTFDKRMVIEKYIRTSDTKVLRMLLELNIIRPNHKLNELKGDYDSLFDYAIKYQVINVIRMFLKYECNINVLNESGKTPLMLCVQGIERMIDMTILDLLLENGADPNKEDYSGYIAMDYINNSYMKHIIEDTLRDFGSREGTVVECVYEEYF